MFTNIFNEAITTNMNLMNYLVCIGVSLLLGMVLSLVYMYKSRYTKSFVVTLAMLPAVVAVVILMVNGNVGTGVAVAGAFSLVRFRSVPGTAKEIGMIFLSMGAGLICGMGFLGYACVFTLVMGLVMILLQMFSFGGRGVESMRVLRISVPEDFNDTNLFDDLMEEYTTKWECMSVKTSNMGSIFKFSYQIQMKSDKSEKEFIDKLRCRNGNLEISLGRMEANNGTEL